jgi:integrase
MGKKPYSLWKRRLESGKTVYYVRFRLDDGSWSTAKSSGEKTKTAAEAWAIKYLSSGQIILKENVLFKDFADNFFDYQGAFVQSQLNRGRSFGRRHAENQNSIIKNYLVKEFGDVKLSKIDSTHIEEYTQELVVMGKSPSTINKILLALRVILQDAYKKKYLQKLPLIEMLPNQYKERGILSVEEVKAFFAQEWKDHRYYTINLLAATTGMRVGEIRALQRKSVCEGYLEVSASWEKGFGLKGTKTGRNRYIPLPQKTQEALAKAMEVSPFTDPDDFIFFGRKREAPLDHRIIERNFYDALIGIGITDDIRRERRICFHSWRHFYNSLLINSRVPVIKVQKLTGHSTQRMTENYFHTDDYQDVIDITGEVLS